MQSPILFPSLLMILGGLAVLVLWFWWSSVTWQRRAFELDGRLLALQQEAHQLRADCLRDRAKAAMAANRTEE